MNSVLFSIGVIIVAILCAAMFGPYFIDWNGYRSILEAELGDAIGRPVYIDGDLEVRLLPTPYLQARDIGVRSRASEGGIPLVSAPYVRATVALAPLLRGELKLTELDFDNPVIQVFWHEDGSIEMPGLPDAGNVPIAPDHVSLETIAINDGTIVLRNEQLAEIRTFTEFNLTGEAGSLTGPFKAEGGVMVDGEINAFKLATGRLQGDGSLKAKAALRPAGGLFDLALDGDFAMPEGRPVFIGKLRLSGSGADAGPVPPAGANDEGASTVPWRLSADLAADSARLAFSALNLGLGARDRAINLSGNGLIELGDAHRAKLVVSAKQIDLDRALVGQAGDRASVSAGLHLLADALRKAGELPFPVELDASIDAIVMNGGLMEEVALESTLDRTKVDIARLSMRLPGKAEISARGEISGERDDPSWNGSVSVSTRQAGQLIDWLGSDALALGPIRAKPGASEINLQTDVRKAAQSFALTNLALSIDQSKMTGSIVYETGDKARLDLNMDVQSFDFDRYFELTGRDADKTAARTLFGLDQSTLRLRAGNLVLGGVAAHDLVADLSYDDGALAVTSLSVGDLGGAAIALEGRIDDPFGAARGNMRASLNAEDLSGLAALLRDLNLKAAAAVDLDQLKAMAPASLQLALDAEPDAQGTSATLRAEGALAATRVKMDAGFSGRLQAVDGAKLALSVSASNPEAHVLLRQAGIKVRAADLLHSTVNPAGAVELIVDDAYGAHSPVRLTASIMDTRVDFSGDGGFSDGMPKLTGQLAVKGPDLRSALALFELPGSVNESPLSMDINTQLDLSPGKAAFNDIRGIAGANTLSGALAVSWVRGQPGPPRLTGKLDLDEVDPKPLLAIFLGNDSFVIDSAAAGGTGGLWPETPFDPTRIGMINGDIAIAARQADIPGLPRSGETAFRLVMGARGFEIRDIKVAMVGGSLGGRLAIARSGREAALQAQLALTDAPLERLLWAPDGRAVATGTGSFSLQVSGEGRSVLGLVSSLDGEGSFNIREGILRGLDPTAFTRIVAAADAGLDLSDAKVQQVFRGFLAAGELPYDSFDGVFAISNGVGVARNTALKTSAADMRVSALLDLHDMRLNSEWQLAPPASQQGQTAIPPVAIIFSGALARPARKLNVNALTGFLTVRRLERDVKRLEEAQADALERQRFDREIRWLTQERIKRIRAARELAAQEEERRRAEAEKQRLLEIQNLESNASQSVSPTSQPADLPQGISGAIVPPVSGQPFAPTADDRQALDNLVGGALSDAPNEPDITNAIGGSSPSGSTAKNQTITRPIAPPLQIVPPDTSAQQAPRATQRYWRRSDPSAPVLPAN